MASQGKQHKISKRQFIKYGAIGTGGIIASTQLIDLFAGGSGEQSTGKAASNSDLWKWSREGYHYIQTPRGAKCNLCPNNCILEEGETGDCRNRVNSKEKIYSIAYGNPCAVHLDPIEKKPLYHFLPESKALSIATAGCNLACMNCQNWSISQKSPKETDNKDLMPDAVIAQATQHNVTSIAYTYTEPISFYEYTYDTAKLARQEGIKNVMITSGYIHKKPLRELCKYIDGANVDLKSFSNQTYMKLNAGGLQPILDTLQIMKEENVWVEITNLIVPEWTDDMDMIKKMCNWLYENGFQDNPLHFSRFYPTYKLQRLPSTPISTLQEARGIAQKAGLKHVYIGNAPGSGATDTICPNCGKTIIGRKGYHITQNHIKNGKCSYCGTKIAGVWR